MSITGYCSTSCMMVILTLNTTLYEAICILVQLTVVYVRLHNIVFYFIFTVFLVYILCVLCHMDPCGLNERKK